MQEINDTVLSTDQAMALGIMLGQRRAFGLVAGRCSAAHAECLRKIRDEKIYLKFVPNWTEFCEQHLKINKRTADRAIALLKKHGPLYFETAALTGITAMDFERIEPAIQRDGIHVDDDVIALLPENAARAADAVARLLAEAAAADAALPDPLASVKIYELEKRGLQLCIAFYRAAKDTDSSERELVLGTIRNVGERFKELELELQSA